MSNDQYLTFFIRAEEYAVSILHVREIIEYEAVTRVPAMPLHVRGVINLRGAVLPVIDLAARFGHGESLLTRTTCIVVVEAKLNDAVTSIGLLADSVSEVIDLALDHIEPPPKFGTNLHVSFLRGMGKLQGRLVLVLDLDQVLSPLDLELTLGAAVTAEQQHVPGVEERGPFAGDASF